MVRFYDKTAITSINTNDILPITDISDSSNDKKVSISQLNTYFSNNLTTFAKTDLSNTDMLTDAILVAPNGVLVAGSGNSSIIAKSGMQLLFANGRKADGGFNSISYTLSADVTQSITTLSNGDYVMFLSNSGTLSYTTISQVYISRTQPTVSTSTAYWYDIITNYWKRTTNTGSSWSNITINALGQFTITSGAVSKLIPNSTAYIPNGEALMVRDASNITAQGKNNLKSYLSSDFVKTDSTAQTVAGVKTFTGNPVFQGSSYDTSITVKRTGASGAFVKFSNDNGTKGYIGVDNLGNPKFANSSGSPFNIVRNSVDNTATGSTTQPCYIDANGVAQTCTVTEVRTVVQASSTDILPSWWRVWSDGFIEQGGFSSGDGWMTVSFTKTFSNTSYSIQLTGRSTNREGSEVAHVDADLSNITTSSMKISGWGLNVTNGGIYWQACGY